MASLLGVLNIAQSALAAQSAGLAVTSENVSNATTPGYVRRRALLQDEVLGSQSAGVRFGGVQRQYDRFATARVVGEQGLLGAATARSSALADVQALVAPSTGSIGDRVSTFFTAVETLTANPTDAAARQGVLAGADSLAQSISQTAGGLAQKSADMLAQAQGIAGDLNQSLAQIAVLDQKIQESTSLGDGAADLRDQRDQLVKDVADKIGAQTVEDDGGHFTLLSSGVALVDGNDAVQVAVTADPSGAVKVTAQHRGGAANDVTAGVGSGTLGGLREARDVDLKKTQGELDQYAYDLATAVNQVHAAGYGADGVSGRNLFAPPTQVAGAAAAMSLDTQMVGRPDRIAAAASAAELPGGNGGALALVGLATQPLGGGTADPTQRFTAIASGVGTAKLSADADQSLRESTSAQASSLEQSAEGVNLDEEMVALSQYQTAFQASQKVLSVTNQLLGELMQEL